MCRISSAAIGAVLLLCTGCAQKTEKADGWKAANYQAADLKTLMLPDFTDPTPPDADDVSEEALHAYNILLGYLENEISVSYQLCDYYYVDFDEIPKAYVIKVIPDNEKPAELDSGNIPENAVMLTCKKDGSNPQSGVVPHLMARQWTKDLQAELAKLYPDWHLNTWYLMPDNICPGIKSGQYADIRDYSEILKKIAESQYGCDMYINILLPAGTAESDAEHFMEAVKPLMQSYSVSNVTFVAPANDDALKEFLAEEKWSGNTYSYAGEKAAWTKSFPVSGTAG